MKSSETLVMFFLTIFGGTFCFTPAGIAQTWLNNRGASISIGKGTAITLDGNLYNDSSGVIRNSGIIGHTDVIKNYGTIELSDTGSVMTVDSMLYLEAGKVRLGGSKNSLIIYNKDTVALQRTGGYLIAENPNWGKVIWHVGDAESGTYVVPFFTDSLEDVSIALKVLVKGDSLGALEFSTYGTGNYNLPVPSQVHSSATVPIDSNSLRIADRFWWIEASSYSQSPVANLVFKMMDKELAGEMN